MRINDITLASELENVLKSHLMIGNATSANVQAFLQAQDLECSPAIRRSDGIRAGGSSYWRFLQADCDSYRSCSIQGKVRWTRFERKGRWPWQWLLNWIFYDADDLDRMLLFSFRSDILVEIKVISA